MTELPRDQLDKLDENIRTAEAVMLWAKGRIEQLEAALREIADMAEPSLPAEYEDCARIARAALEGG